MFTETIAPLPQLSPQNSLDENIILNLNQISNSYNFVFQNLDNVHLLTIVCNAMHSISWELSCFAILWKPENNFETMNCKHVRF